MKRVFVLLMACSLLLTMAGCGLFNKEKDVTMLVYLDEDLSDVEARSIGTVLNTLPEVTESEFVHREDALAEFLEDYEDSAAFSGIDASVLQHRYKISAKTTDADALAEVIEEIEGVDEVKVVEVSWLTKLWMKIKY